jgi:nitrate/TMAO reductase-like tetraheme cytochrome c subunit
MRSEIQDERNTNPEKLILFILSIVVGLLIIGIVGGYIFTKKPSGIGTVTSTDSSIITKSDILKK